MKELCWDYYNGYYYEDKKMIKDRNTLTKEEKKLLDDIEKSKKKKRGRLIPLINSFIQLHNHDILSEQIQV